MTLMNVELYTAHTYLHGIGTKMAPGAGGVADVLEPNAADVQGEILNP
jgi:hypothetical protein